MIYRLHFVKCYWFTNIFLFSCAAKDGTLWGPRSTKDWEYLEDLEGDTWLGVQYDGSDWRYTDDDSIFSTWPNGKSPSVKSGKICLKRSKKGDFKADDCTHNHEYTCGFDCNSGICSTGETCQNTVGSYTCVAGVTTTPNGTTVGPTACPTGYKMGAENECKDVNECEWDHAAFCKVSESKIKFEAAVEKCHQAGGSLWPSSSNADFEYIDNLETDLWIGIKFDGQDWRFLADNAIFDEFNHWKNGKLPDMSGKNSDKVCVKREKKGTFKADDCSHDHEYLCDSPLEMCDGQNQKSSCEPVKYFDSKITWAKAVTRYTFHFSNFCH